MTPVFYIFGFVAIASSIIVCGFNLLKKVRLAIAVNDDFIEPTVEGICEGARTGHIGDGKIFVLPIEDCIRIRTGEHGPDAIG